MFVGEEAPPPPGMARAGNIRAGPVWNEGRPEAPGDGWVWIGGKMNEGLMPHGISPSSYFAVRPRVGCRHAAAAFRGEREGRKTGQNV